MGEGTGFGGLFIHTGLLVDWQVLAIQLLGGVSLCKT